MRPHDGRAIPTFIRQALDEKPLTVFGDGSQTRSFCYVDDLDPRPHPARRVRRAPARQHRQPGGDDAARARRGGARARPARRARSSSRRSPSTTRRCASPTSPAPSSCSAGSRRSGSTRGCAARWRRWEETAHVHRLAARRSSRPLVGLASPSLRRPRRRTSCRSASSTTAACCTASPTRSSRSSRSTGTQLVRVNLWWAGPGSGVATRRPRQPAPTRPTPPTTGTRTTARCGSRSRTGSTSSSRSSAPRRGRTPPRAGTSRRRTPPTCGSSRPPRRSATAGRSSTPDGVTLPRVSAWIAWNEPNNPVFLKPQFVRAGATGSIQSGRDYATICNAVVAGREVACAHAPKVACGATGPRGNNNPNSSRPSVSPLAFLRAMKAGGATRLRRLRPPPVLRLARRDPLDEAAARQARPAADRGHARQLRRCSCRSRPALRQANADLDHRVRLPDEPARQALRRHRTASRRRTCTQAVALAAQHPRIDMFLWFLLRDERAPRRLAVGPRHGRRQAQAKLRRVPARGRADGASGVALACVHGEGLRRGAGGRGGRASPRGARGRARRERPQATRARRRGLHAPTTRAALPRLGGRGRPRRAVRLGRGLGDPRSCAALSEHARAAQAVEALTGVYAVPRERRRRGSSSSSG